MNKLFLWRILIIALTSSIATAQDIISDGFAFNLLSDSEAELVALPDGKKYEGDIIVPASACGGRYTVVKIGDWAFKDCTRLTSVDMYGMVRADIGVEAMAGCTNLRRVIMPYMLLYPMKIGNRAFMNSSCDYLEIPPNVTEIGDSAFFGMNIKEIALGSSDLTNLGSAILANSTVEYVIFHMYSFDVNSVRRIPENTFLGCTKLCYIQLPELLTEIGANAFHGCKSLKALSVPPFLCKIGDNAFSGVELDCISFISFDKLVDEVPKYLFSSICGQHIPKLIVFPADREKTYRKWCPKMFKRKTPLLVTGRRGFWIYDGVMIKKADNTSDLCRGVNKPYKENAKILINKGSDMAICLPTLYGGGKSRGYSATVNGVPKDIEYIPWRYHIFGGMILYDNPFVLQLKDIRSPCTINIDWNN